MHSSQLYLPSLSLQKKKTNLSSVRSSVIPVGTVRRSKMVLLPTENARADELEDICVYI